MAELIYLRDVATLVVDQERCVGCGSCLEVCPHQVLALEEKKAKVRDLDACMECGACAINCPVQAIQVESGVGCASALLNQALGRSGACCSG